MSQRIILTHLTVGGSVSCKSAVWLGLRTVFIVTVDSQVGVQHSGSDTIFSVCSFTDSKQHGCCCVRTVCYCRQLTATVPQQLITHFSLTLRFLIRFLPTDKNILCIFRFSAKSWSLSGVELSESCSAEELQAIWNNTVWLLCIMEKESHDISLRWLCSSLSRLKIKEQYIYIF